MGRIGGPHEPVAGNHERAIARTNRYHVRACEGLVELVLREDVERFHRVRPKMPAERGGAYLAACTIYRDDAAYLAEWIEFHRLMGVERFFLYDNGSTDHHREVLAPYLEEGIGHAARMGGSVPGSQRPPRRPSPHSSTASASTRHDARWIAFLDIDEFLFSPGGASLPDVLRDYEEFPGVVVNRAEFGPSGHMTKPDG